MGLRNRLVHDARNWYKWASTWVLMAIPLVTAAQEEIEVVREYLPRWVVAVLAFAAFGARLYRQEKLHRDTDS